MTKFPVFIISGATASGKTSLSITLAQNLKSKGFSAEIVNFDSLLFYKDLNIGTAKPSQEERKNIPHHLIDICDIHQEMNASKFNKMAQSLISNLHRENKIPILVGGSAFYIRALIKGMYKGPSISEQTKQEVEHILNEKGFSYIRNMLKHLDPSSYQSLHENDQYRNIRAFEFYYQLGRPISQEKNEIVDPYDFEKNQHPQWDIFHIYLDIPKEEHWPIIKMRTQKMITQGLLCEVSNILKNKELTNDEKCLQSIGYKEAIDYLQNQNPHIESQKDLCEQIYISTRQLAKSQKTFFKKIKPKHTYHPLNDKNKILEEGLSFLSKYQI